LCGASRGAHLPSANPPPKALTLADVERAGLARGVRLETSFIGPFFRVSARPLEESGDSPSILGVHEGLLLPLPGLSLLHMDSVRVFETELSRPRGRQKRGRQPPGEAEAGDAGQSAGESAGAAESRQNLRRMFGLSVLLGAVGVLHARNLGCEHAELLAIHDADFAHKRLVKFYTRLGFTAVRYVSGEKVQDVPDLLVWGGRGTLMRAPVADLVRRWTPTILKQAAETTQAAHAKPGP